MTDNEKQWTEQNSSTYQQLSAVAVPARAEQLATLLTLLPYTAEDTFEAVELASGEGYLAAALLTAFPRATLTALDGSPLMLEATAVRLKPFTGRWRIAAFDMFHTQWYSHLNRAGAVLSSLCIHHLDGLHKRRLFRAVSGRLHPKGAFMIADLVQSTHAPANEVYAAAWDADARAQSAAVAGDDSLYRLFVAEDWNHYRTPDPVDRPSPLFDQLRWLHDAGLRGVDAYWLRAGHAIYGGYGPQTNLQRPGLSYDAARAAVEKVLG